MARRAKEEQFLQGHAEGICPLILRMMFVESLLLGGPRGILSRERPRARGRTRWTEVPTVGPTGTGNRERTMKGIFYLFSLSSFLSLSLSLCSFSFLETRRRGGRDHAVAQQHRTGVR